MTTIKTVADRRVVAEQGVVLNQYVGPLNWEHYKIPASGLSNSQITFANLVTLGTNRIYDSGFSVEYTLEVTLTNPPSGGYTAEDVRSHLKFMPFPLHMVTDQLRTNINGAACMTRPQESLPQRMMYWRQRVLDKSCNYCPHTRMPSVQDSFIDYDPSNLAHWRQDIQNFQCAYGKNGSQNMGKPLECLSFAFDTNTNVATITFREPVLCSPFNQRLDELYQSPLFNVTSIDIVYQLNNLTRMILPAFVNNVFDQGTGTQYQCVPYKNLIPQFTSINITAAQLCFNVASMPTGMTVPPILQLPYYDNVCYVTNANVQAGTTGVVSITSGVYTLAQVPTAIYVFVSENQLYRSNGNAFVSSYCPIRDINITMGNNTQLLTTTTEFDRYNMALANGLEDVSWEEFTSSQLTPPDSNTANSRNYTQGERGNKCILRLIPGVDLLIPDKRLVGGSDAEQMVFQVRLNADVTGTPNGSQPYLALWVMFEYCGVLTIEPVHASIDMLPIKGALPPIGNVDTVASSNVERASGGGEGTNPRGAGIFDFLQKIPIVGNVYSGIRKAVNSDIGRKVISFLGKELIDPAPPAKRQEPMIQEVPKGGTIIGGDVLGKFYQ